MVLHSNNNRFRLRRIILLLVIVSTAVLIISPVSAEKPFVTIVAKGDQSYYMGEKVVFSGMNTDSDSTYLIITGPNLPEGGGKLASPSQNPVSGDPGSFTFVKTKPDKTWEYTWYTSDLQLDAGTYTIYAESRPETKDQSKETTFATVSIIYKKPFITAGISPSTISKGMPFTISGFAEGFPPNVQIWIFGKDSYSNSTVSVNPDASFRYVIPQEVTSRLAIGQYFVVVQHPMADNQFDFVVRGDYVRNLKLNNGTDIFRITGSGSLQGSDAANALTTAISNREAHDTTLTNDTYTLIPFQLTDAESGSTLQETTASTAPVQQPTRHAPLQYAPIGALVLIVGIGAWRRH